MRLRHIEVIQALLQTGNLGHAAELLQLPTATLSATLQEAEQQLGFMLFSSVRGRLQATRDTLVLQPLITQLYRHLSRYANWATSCASIRSRPCAWRAVKPWPNRCCPLASVP